MKKTLSAIDFSLSSSLLGRIGFSSINNTQVQSWSSLSHSPPPSSLRGLQFPESKDHSSSVGEAVNRQDRWVIITDRPFNAAHVRTMSYIYHIVLNLEKRRFLPTFARSRRLSSRSTIERIGYKSEACVWKLLASSTAIQLLTFDWWPRTTHFRMIGNLRQVEAKWSDNLIYIYIYHTDWTTFSVHPTDLWLIYKSHYTTTPTNPTDKQKKWTLPKTLSSPLFPRTSSSPLSQPSQSQQSTNSSSLISLIINSLVVQLISTLRRCTCRQIMKSLNWSGITCSVSLWFFSFSSICYSLLFSRSLTSE